MKLGIIGAGGIAEKVSATLSKLPETELYAVGSRSREKAEAFAKKCGYQKAYGSYEELFADPCVELVYICTPHSEHYQNMKDALNAGKHVICEKAFTMNAGQAKEVAALAKEKGLYLAEAVWPRYMPSCRAIDEVIESGIVGKPISLFTNFAQNLMDKDRLTNPMLAGGALLDLGVYGLHFIIAHFGKDIEEIRSEVEFTDKGVDAAEHILFKYKDGRTASTMHSLKCFGNNLATICCENGLIIADDVNAPKNIKVYSKYDRLIKEISLPFDITGYEYEFREAVRLINEGKTESESLPISESIYMMELCDKLRADWGLVYPQERKTEEVQ